MKHRIVLFIVVILALLASVGSTFAQSTVATGTVTAWALNVRTAPSINAQRIGTLRWGYTAGVVGKNSDSSWYQIILEGGSGWVSGQYLAVTNAHTVPVTYNSQTPTNPPAVAGGLVNTGALNIRPIPSPTNNVPITYVLRNTPLTIFGRNADSSWYKVVTSNNVQGWVRSTYVNVTSGDINSLPVITENVPTPTPAPTMTQGYVNTGALNIRHTPSPFNNVPIKYILRNTTVNIVGRTGDSEWYQVRVDNTLGWVRGKYITVTNGDIGSLPITG